MGCLEGLPEMPRAIAVKVFSTPGERFVRGDVLQTRLTDTEIRNQIETSEGKKKLNRTFRSNSAA